MLAAVSIEPTFIPDTVTGTRTVATGGAIVSPICRMTLPSASKMRWRVSLSSASGTSMSWLRRSVWYCQISRLSAMNLASRLALRLAAKARS